MCGLYFLLLFLHAHFSTEDVHCITSLCSGRRPNQHRPTKASSQPGSVYMYNVDFSSTAAGSTMCTVVVQARCSTVVSLQKGKLLS